MNSKYIVIIILCLSFSNKGQAQDTLADLFHASYKVFELCRNDANGLYRDAKLFSGTDYHPSSVANIGIGLIALCIADTMGWENNAEQQVLLTLETMNGNTTGVQFDRSPNGFFRHWVNMNTGATEWNSEYSTIDNAILLSGAFFCKKYFSQNTTIADKVDELWRSIDWTNVVADTLTGALYREMNTLGNGQAITLPYNEYMILAWMAMKAEGDNGGLATSLWNRHFENTTNLPTIFYQGIELLTDHPSNYVPSFVLQSPYYLCHYFTTSPDYIQYLENARVADSLWFQLNTSAAPYEFGLGGGSYLNSFGYHATKINDNAAHVVSPNIVGGFHFTEEHLLNYFRNQKGVYMLPTAAPNQILWRYSLQDPLWSAPEVQGIDYAHMLLGLASMPQFLGIDFFKDNNDFDYPLSTSLNHLNEEKYLIKVFPNPMTDGFQLEVDVNLIGSQGLILNSLGQVVQSFSINEVSQHIKLGNTGSGIYYLEIRLEDGNFLTKQILLQK